MVSDVACMATSPHRQRFVESRGWRQSLNLRTEPYMWRFSYMIFLRPVALEVRQLHGSWEVPIVSLHSWKFCLVICTRETHAGVRLGTSGFGNRTRQSTSTPTWQEALHR